MEEIAMLDLIDKIISEIESDPRIDAREISLDITSKGFLKKRKTLNINGMMESNIEKDRVLEIVKKQAGNNYDVADKLVIV
jgi:hypothetical protein